MTDHPTPTQDRRTALKALAAAAGAATISALPSVWSKPLVRGGALPAHAQTSGPTLSVEMTWVDSSPADFDLAVDEPGGGLTYVGYDPNNASTGVSFNSPSAVLSHSGDNLDDTSGTETVTQIASLPNGLYAVVLAQTFLGNGPRFIVTITFNGVQTIIDSNIYGSIPFDDWRLIATISVPDGTIDTSGYNTAYP